MRLIRGKYYSLNGFSAKIVNFDAMVVKRIENFIFRGNMKHLMTFSLDKEGCCLLVKLFIIIQCMP